MAQNSSDIKDELGLIHEPMVQRMLVRDGPGEQIRFSEFATKINRKDKPQTRILLITDRAIYNLIPSKYRLKRRIDLKNLMGLSISTSSDEFVIHVDGEYDYRYQSAQRELICNILGKIFRDLNNKRLPIKKMDVGTLKDHTLTKVRAKVLSGDEIYRRRNDFELNESDEEDQNALQQSSQFAQVNTTIQPQQQQQQQQQHQSNHNQQKNHHHQDDEGDDGEDGDVVTQMTSVTQSKVNIGDFEFMKVLGRGSFGKVMQVRHKTNGNIYAMKILKKSSIVARNQVEHTRAERKILEALQHPFLMTLRWAFQTKDKLYFVLDYFTGGELFYHLKNVRRFPEEVARIYIAEIALALGHLHSLGYIYRDLKPENILLDNTGHVCLTDFGLSKDVQEGDKAHTFCGTPEYLAPEIVSGQGHDKAVDWWALGILLYELTVGIPPFYDGNPNEMYNKIQRGILRFPPFLSDSCKSIIVALLNRTPERRLGSENDVEDIKNHPFYHGLDWDKLLRREIEVDFKPHVVGNDDTSNFDPTFTSEPVVDSLATPSSLANATDFSGFTYDQGSGFL